MPIILEHISQPSDKDRAALTAIYQDYPIQGSQTVDMDDYLQQQLTKGLQLHAGRFNGQLVTALWLEPGSNYYQIRNLCVHPATRRRGVARQTLTLLSKNSPCKPMRLYIDDSDLPDYLRHLPGHCGFTHTPSTRAQPRGWYSNPA